MRSHLEHSSAHPGDFSAKSAGNTKPSKDPHSPPKNPNKSCSDGMNRATTSAETDSSAEMIIRLAGSAVWYSPSFSVYKMLSRVGAIHSVCPAVSFTARHVYAT